LPIAKAKPSTPIAAIITPTSLPILDLSIFCSHSAE
jgi:hypothetical protein